MKKLSKLVPAICMLLISACMLGTSTYAWFSMNRTVTATGMSVTAEAPASLLISNTSATANFGATTALTNDVSGAAAKFVPVSYAGVCANWYKLTDVGMADIDEKGRAKSFTEVTDGSTVSAFTDTKIGENVVYAAADTMIFHDTIWLKLEGDAAEDKDIICTATYVDSPAVSDKIKDAMHVVFVVGGVVKATIDMGASSTTTDTLMTLVANTDGTQVDVYYFLSGLDSDCANVNIAADRTMSIDLTFEVVED